MTGRDQSEPMVRPSKTLGSLLLNENWKSSTNGKYQSSADTRVCDLSVPADMSTVIKSAVPVSALLFTVFNLSSVCVYVCVCLTENSDACVCVSPWVFSRVCVCVCRHGATLMSVDKNVCVRGALVSIQVYVPHNVWVIQYDSRVGKYIMDIFIKSSNRAR